MIEEPPHAAARWWLDSARGSRLKVVRSGLAVTLDRCVVTVGNYDGVHRGHVSVITELVGRAAARGVPSVAVTFSPHTRAVVGDGGAQPVLTTTDEKAVLAGRLGVDYLISLRFDRRAASMSAEDFVEKVLIGRLGAVEWIMGEGHMFGRGRLGTLEALRTRVDKNHFSTFAVRPASLGKGAISSTEIREHFLRGEVSEAVRKLGHPYLVRAPRVSGRGKGRQMGFPTMNFAAPLPPKVIPRAGVYAAELEMNGTAVKGGLYVGECPTFERRDLHFEFHALEDPPGSMEARSGEEGNLWIHRFIREEMNFDDENRLAGRIQQDIDEAGRFFLKENT